MIINKNNDNGSGPWGNGGNQNPWGKRPNSNGTPPDVDQMIRELRFKKHMFFCFTCASRAFQLLFIGFHKF